MKTEPYDYHDGWYEQRLHEPARRRLKSFTMFCSMPDSPRGSYDEEIDVRALNPAIARRIAAAVIEDGYEDGLAVRRVVQRVPGFYF